MTTFAKWQESMLEALVRHLLGSKSTVVEQRFKVFVGFANDKLRNHQYLTADYKKISSEYEGLIEKFHIHNEEKKSIKLKRLFTRFQKSLAASQYPQIQFDNIYAVLSVLFHLSSLSTNDKSSYDSMVTSYDNLSFYDDAVTHCDAVIDRIKQWEKEIEECSEEEDYEEETPMGKIIEEQTKTEPIKQDDSMISLALQSIQTFELAKSQTQTTEIVARQGHFLHSQQIFGPNGTIEKKWPLKSLSNRYTTEKYIIDQALDLIIFCNNKNNSVFGFLDNKFVIKDYSFTLNHISSNALKSILNEISYLANIKLKLQSFIDKNFNSSHFGPCFQALANSLFNFLQKFEKAFKDKYIATIIELKDTYLKMWSDFEFFYEVIRNIENSSIICTCRLLTILFQMTDNRIISNDKTAKLSIQIFFDVFTPYISAIDLYIQNGQLPKTKEHNFFCITMTNYPNISISNVLLFWHKALAIKTHRFNNKATPCVPEFLAPIISPILLSGKSVLMLQGLHDYSINEKSLLSIIAEQLTLTDNNLLDRSNTSHIIFNTVPNTFSTPFIILFKNCILKSIYLRANIPRVNLLQVFEQKCNLRKNLSAIRGLNLMSCSESWRYFLNDLFTLVDSKDSNILTSSYRLNMLLQESISQSCSDSKTLFIPERCSIQVISKLEADSMTQNIHVTDDDKLSTRFEIPIQDLDTPTSLIQHILKERSHNIPVHSPIFKTDIFSNNESILKKILPSYLQLEPFDRFLFRWQVEWPLGLIFTTSTFDRYSRVTVFLIKLNRAKHVLQSIIHGKKDKLSYVFQPLFCVRSKMLHFIDCISTYAYDKVIFESWKLFRENIEYTKNIDEVCILHEEYLDSLLSQIMMGPKAAAALRKILSNFELCMRLRYIHDSIGDLNIESNRNEVLGYINELQTEFDQNTRLLLSVFAKVLSQGRHPHCIS